MATETRSLSTHFPNGLRPDLLRLQIQGAGLTACFGIEQAGDVVSIFFTGDLTEQQIATLNAVISAHVPQRINAELYVVVTIAENEVVVTEDQAWQKIAGMVGNPSFFAKVVGNCFGQVLGEVDVVGSGAQVRVVEYNYAAATEEEKLPPSAVAATSGWALLSKLTTVAGRTGHSRFELQARLNGATSMKLRHVSMGLLEWF